MPDDLQWVSQPAMVTVDGSMAPTNEKFRIVVNTEGFQPSDIDVYTKGRKLHINAFRHEDSGTGTQSTKRLERCYDVPHDADINAMSVRFVDDRRLLIEFPIEKSAFCDPRAADLPSNSNARPGGVKLGKTTRSSSHYEAEEMRSFGSPVMGSLDRSARPAVPSSYSTPCGVRQFGHAEAQPETKLHRATLVNVQEDSRRSVPSRQAGEGASMSRTLVEEEITTEPFYSRPSFSPRIVRDEQTGQQKVVLSLEVHGYDPGDFHVTVNNLKLSVEAKHSDETEDHSKRRYFQREVTLPPGTDVNRLKTLLVDGCQLEIEAPYIEQRHQSFSVPIQRQV